MINFELIVRFSGFQKKLKEKQKTEVYQNSSDPNVFGRHHNCLTQLFGNSTQKQQKFYEFFGRLNVTRKSHRHFWFIFNAKFESKKLCV